MNFVKLYSFGDTIRKYREEKELPLRVVAAYLDIDQAILSKIERGKRKANRELVLKLARYFQVDADDLVVIWLSERILYELAGERNAAEALRVAEERIAYRRPRSMSRNALISRFKLVMQEYPAIKKAWLFGSFARQEEGEGSDIDVLIDVPKEHTFTLFDLAEVQEKLKNLTNRSIDVVLFRALKPQMKERIKQDLKLFYEA
jgi:predicted nucleotidyltransferase/plasmid maintenance system antidote protein VapI